MATVTMDISELKLMEENKALLEKALEREEQLKESIELILEEKEKAIEDKLKDDTNFDSRFTTKKETLLKHKKPKYKNNFEDNIEE
jgi:hypothetical protein